MDGESPIGPWTGDRRGTGRLMDWGLLGVALLLSVVFFGGALVLGEASRRRRVRKRDSTGKGQVDG